MLLGADVLFAIYVLLLTAGTSMPEQGITNTQVSMPKAPDRTLSKQPLLTFP